MSNPNSGNVVGIDLGTTMSVVAHLDRAGVTQTLSNSDGEPLTPSALYLEGNPAVVGKAAKDASSHYPDKVATIIKRDIGSPFYSRMIDGRQFRPETLSAIILRKLKLDAERRIGPVSKAVITVPAFFDDTRRRATEIAGRIAGLEVLGIINEPTAAALAYALEGDLNKDLARGAPVLPGGELTALVYDLGGGTFDVTVVRLRNREFETIATDGEVKLGGKDWDDRIGEFIGGEFAKKHGVNPVQDAQRAPALAKLAENVKLMLTKLPSAPVEFSYQDSSLNVHLTRKEFEEMTRHLVTRTRLVTNLVVSEQAGLQWSDIDRVLLVGGSTRMPMVKEMLARTTQQTPDDTIDPDQVVARGAAIYAAIESAKNDSSGLQMDEEVNEKLRSIQVDDVNAHSLGIEILHPRDKRLVNVVLIPKNSRLPMAESKVFRTNRAGATNVRVRVLEGEAEEAADNVVIGECVVENLPAGLPSKSPVQVRLNYDTSGRVHVMALDMTGGVHAHAEIRNQAGLTEEDIRRESEFVQNLNIQ